MIKDMGLQSFCHSQESQSTNETLAREGYIGCSPISVTTAISFPTLEAFRQLHRVCPRLTIRAFIKALFFLHQVSPHHVVQISKAYFIQLSFRPYLVNQFSIAFDAYLQILGHVELRVSAALQHNEPAWQRQSTCPPCMYKEEGEISSNYSMLCAMDGSSSLKLIDPGFRSGAAQLNNRTVPSAIWLTPEEVDVFKSEVPRPAAKACFDLFQVLITHLFKSTDQTR
jgi:hypothetical protein